MCPVIGSVQGSAMGFFIWSMLGLVMGSMFGSVMESFLDITLIKCIKGHKSEKSHTLCLN